MEFFLTEHKNLSCKKNYAKKGWQNMFFLFDYAEYKWYTILQVAGLIDCFCQQAATAVRYI